MIMVDDIFQQEAEDDLKTIEFIRNYLPTEVKERFSDKDGNFDDELIQYFLDVIWEYYYNTFSDTDDEVEILKKDYKKKGSKSLFFYNPSRKKSNISKISSFVAVWFILMSPISPNNVKLIILELFFLSCFISS